MKLRKRINVLVFGRSVVFSTLVEDLTMEKIISKIAKRLHVDVSIFEGYKFYLDDFTLVDGIKYLRACSDSGFLLYFL